jgi:hypothetical protein
MSLKHCITWQSRCVSSDRDPGITDWVPSYSCPSSKEQGLKSVLVSYRTQRGKGHPALSQAGVYLSGVLGRLGVPEGLMGNLCTGPAELFLTTSAAWQTLRCGRGSGSRIPHGESLALPSQFPIKGRLPPGAGEPWGWALTPFPRWSLGHG